MSHGNYNHGQNRRSGEHGYPGGGYGNNGDNYGNNNSGGYGGGYNYPVPPGPPPPQANDYGYAPPPGPPPSDDYYNSDRSYGGGSGYNNSGNSYNDGYRQGTSPQAFPGQGYAQNSGFGSGSGPSGSGGGRPGFPGDGYAGSGNYGPGSGSNAQRGGRPSFPGEGYTSPGGYNSNPDFGGPPRFPGEGYGGAPPPPPPRGGAYGMPGSDYNMPGSDYSMPGGDYGLPPTGNVSVVRHRFEDIDFAGSQFPTWNTATPTPPPTSGQGGGYSQQPTHGQIPTYNIPQEMQQEASNVVLSNCHGRKRALLIGVNYFGSKHMLKGCINDVHNIKKFIIEHFGFKESDMVVLTDDQRDNPRRMPTHDNIIKAMRWLVSDARMNDSFFFHYSGHGIIVPSKTSDEIDGNDEAICPVDFETKGTIIDDNMNSIMVRPLPRGARLTAIFDCCHSATALDLPFMYNHLGKLKNEKAISYTFKGLKAVGESYLKGDLAGAVQGFVKSADMFLTGDSKLEKARKTKSSLGDVVMFSGCKDDQTSADTKTASLNKSSKEDVAFTGAMSHALISSMNNNPHQTYVQLLQDIRKRLEVKYTQVPQLSAGRLMDMNTVFLM
ncbi:Ca(2+)-dependent cysteine protease [Coemansia thaxteri]|uniref:Ca(2+)-dependent cysteine protease n=1 Tax=Coemansia thaxteri TaxID=2663907 RepID=A0A9W8BG39_9FUNG|nr:Ca(2+)-dependent cysteine protease [Coemansia thaxteri]